MIAFKPLQHSEVDVITKMMKEFYDIDNYPMDLEISKKLFEEFIENENLGKSYLIYNNSEIVGYAIMTFIFSFEYKGRLAFFEELFIDKSARNLGIGTKAIDFIKQEAKKANVKMIYLEVENHNEIAQKLYLANDFVIHNRKIMKSPIKCNSNK
jgi:ribosomal protein S18 acetylase RimI-like enzyme